MRTWQSTKLVRRGTVRRGGNPPVPVQKYRDRRTWARAVEQVVLYMPCRCGSGNKYKFCCRGKEKAPEEGALAGAEMEAEA
jgi:hypothetical protein